jgi:hypothetical protein
MLVGADDGAVNMMQLPVQATLGISGFLETRQQPVEDAALLPKAETTVDRLPRAIARWEVPPRGASAQYPEHSIEHEPVIFGWPPALALSLR